MEKQEKQAIEILHMMCGNNGCVISDSGGKDSSVLKHIALKTKNMYGIGHFSVIGTGECPFCYADFVSAVTLSSFSKVLLIASTRTCISK